MVHIFSDVWFETKEQCDPVAGPVENHWGKERDELQTTQSHLLTQCSHPQPKVDYTEQLTLPPENILTSYCST